MTLFLVLINATNNLHKISHFVYHLNNTIMKKFIICAVFALFTMASCKKDLATDAVEQQSSIESNAALSSNPGVPELESNKANNGDQIVRIDITGQQFTNPCTGGSLTVLSGILQFNIAPDGFTIRSTVNSRLVMQDEAGVIYHGVFVETFEQNGSILQGTLHDTLRFILNPQGGDTNLNLHSVLHITVNANGVFTATVEKFTLDCD